MSQRSTKYPFVRKIRDQYIEKRATSKDSDEDYYRIREYGH